MPENQSEKESRQQQQEQVGSSSDVASSAVGTTSRDSPAENDILLDVSNVSATPPPVDSDVIITINSNDDKALRKETSMSPLEGWENDATHLEMHSTSDNNKATAIGENEEEKSCYVKLGGNEQLLGGNEQLGRAPTTMNEPHLPNIEPDAITDPTSTKASTAAETLTERPAQKNEIADENGLTASTYVPETTILKESDDLQHSFETSTPMFRDDEGRPNDEQPQVVSEPKQNTSSLSGTAMNDGVPQSIEVQHPQTDDDLSLPTRTTHTELPSSRAVTPNQEEVKEEIPIGGSVDSPSAVFEETISSPKPHSELTTGNGQHQPPTTATIDAENALDANKQEQNASAPDHSSTFSGFNTQAQIPEQDVDKQPPEKSWFFSLGGALLSGRTGNKSNEDTATVVTKESLPNDDGSSNREFQKIDESSSFSSAKEGPEIQSGALQVDDESCAGVERDSSQSTSKSNVDSFGTGETTLVRDDGKQKNSAKLTTFADLDGLEAQGTRPPSTSNPGLGTFESRGETTDGAAVETIASPVNQTTTSTVEIDDTIPTSPSQPEMTLFSPASNTSLPGLRSESSKNENSSGSDSLDETQNVFSDSSLTSAVDTQTSSHISGNEATLNSETHLPTAEKSIATPVVHGGDRTSDAEELRGFEDHGVASSLTGQKETTPTTSKQALIAEKEDDEAAGSATIASALQDPSRNEGSVAPAAIPPPSASTSKTSHLVPVDSGNSLSGSVEIGDESTSKNEIPTSSSSQDNENTESPASDDQLLPSSSKASWLSSILSLIGLQGNDQKGGNHNANTSESSAAIGNDRATHEPEIQNDYGAPIVDVNSTSRDEVKSTSGSMPAGSYMSLSDRQNLSDSRRDSLESLLSTGNRGTNRNIVEDSDKPLQPSSNIRHSPGTNNVHFPVADGGLEDVVKSDEDIACIRSALLRSPLLNGLDNEQVEQFVQSARLKSFHPGDVVVHEDFRYVDQPISNQETSQQSTAEGAISTQKGSPLKSFMTALEGRHGHGRVRVDLGGQRRSRGHRDSQWSIPSSTLVGPSFIYVIRTGDARAACAWTSSEVLWGPGQVFGERSALFGQPHTVTVTCRSSGPLECWVVDRKTFFEHVLPSSRQDQSFFSLHGRRQTPPNGQPRSQLRDQEINIPTSATQHHLSDPVSFLDSYLLLEDFVRVSIAANQISGKSGCSPWTPWMAVSLAATFRALARSDSRSDPSKVSFEDFCVLQLLQRSKIRQGEDLAYLIMKNETRDYISRIDFERFLGNLHRNQSWFFLSSNGWLVQRYFGGSANDWSQAEQSRHNVSRLIQKENFSELWKELQREMARQSFDQEVKGKPFLSQRDVYRILASTMAWKLSDGVLARLDDILNTNDECEDELQDSQSQGRQDGNDIPASSDQMVTDLSPVPGSGRLLFLNRLLGYDDLISFQEALDQLPTFCDLIQRASQFKRKSLSFDDCLVSNQTYGSGLSTFQMQILFQLFDTDQDGLVSRQDTVKVLGWDPNYRLERTKSGALRMSSTQSDLPQSWLAQEWAKGSTSFFGQARTCFEHFTLITLTSGFAAFALYPFDLVKTRMMNQQTHKLAWTLYKNSFDCFLKTVRIEGLWGLYRGILPQLLGVGPEKMIKLAVNDLLREAFMDERTAAEGNAQWWLEILTGGCAGACQVLVTNPMEVAKIRLQVQGETRNVYMAQGRHVSTSAQTLTAVSARLGLAGHYRGVAACLLRDVPFSAIFFPTFAYCKDTLYHHNQGCSEATNLILAGSFAAIPATLVTNPADVIKTRLQVLRRDDHTAYVGIRDGFVKIYQQEGPSAFYKGCLARMLRTVPQFGVTVWTYEILTRAVGLQRLSAPPTDAPISPQDFHSAFR